MGALYRPPFPGASPRITRVSGTSRVGQYQFEGRVFPTCDVNARERYLGMGRRIDEATAPMRARGYDAVARSRHNARSQSSASALRRGRPEHTEKKEADGKVKRVGPFFLAPGSGSQDDIGGFSLYLGRLDTLQQIVVSEEYEAILYPSNSSPVSRLVSSSAAPKRR